MATLFSCCAWLGIAVFLVGSAIRAAIYARTPVPLRWELYPLPDGAAGQLRYTLAEVLLLRGLWEHNRKLWFRSYPFHTGLYLCTFAVLSTAAGFDAVTNIAALAGLALAGAGAAALLSARLTDPALKPYTSPADLFNLVAFAAVCGLLLAGMAIEGMSPVDLGRSVLLFRPAPLVSGAGVATAALLAAYIPFTHMAHFVAKYFAYHQVRWDDHRSPKVAAQLGYQPRWSARHVNADSAKTWVDIALAQPPEEKKR